MIVTTVILLVETSTTLTYCHLCHAYGIMVNDAILCGNDGIKTGLCHLCHSSVARQGSNNNDIAELWHTYHSGPGSVGNPSYTETTVTRWLLTHELLVNYW